MKVEVDLSEEEFNDLEEFCKHHPDEVKTPAEALKQMAGLKLYRKMKKELDKERKKPSILLQDLGIPHCIPCALDEQLDAFGMTYEEFLNSAILAGTNMLKSALAGDKDAQKKLIELMKEMGLKTLGPFSAE